MTKCVWDFQNNVLWDTHLHALLVEKYSHLTFSWSTPIKNPSTTTIQHRKTLQEALLRRIITENKTVNIRVNERAIYKYNYMYKHNATL